MHVRIEGRGNVRGVEVRRGGGGRHFGQQLDTVPAALMSLLSPTEFSRCLSELMSFVTD